MTFKERYIEAYSNMQKILEELAERAHTYSKIAHPKEAISKSKGLRITESSYFSAMNPEVHREFCFVSTENYWPTLSVSKIILEDNYKDIAAKEFNRKKEARAAYRAHQKELKAQKEAERLAKEIALFEELRKKHGRSE